jgi:hypothetical protein
MNDLVLTGEPVDLVMTVTAGQVKLAGPGTNVSARHHGVGPALATAMDEARRARARAATERAWTPTVEVSLSRTGQLLADSFLPAPVAAGLASVLADAELAHRRVGIGLDVPPRLAGLPWEAIPGPDGRALALHPAVLLYRRAEAATAWVVPGPLRIVIAIAAPDAGGGRCLTTSESWGTCLPQFARPGATRLRCR